MKHDMVVIQFRDRSNDCVAKAFFNVVPISKEERSVIMADTKLKSGGGYTTPEIFSELLRRLKIRYKMRKVKLVIGAKIDWVLAQQDGLFMCFGEQHWVSVNCRLRLIYCCGEIYTLPLTKKSFEKVMMPLIATIRELYC